MKLTIIPAALAVIGLTAFGPARLMAGQPATDADGRRSSGCKQRHEAHREEADAGMHAEGMHAEGMHDEEPHGRGLHRRGRRGRGMQGNRADMQQIHALLANHASVRRSVRKLPNGVETVTTTSDPRVATLLPQHVEAMYARMKEGQLIRGFDPLFVALFRYADKIDVKVEKLKDGVRVIETSRDPYAVKLIQAHAAAVDGFVKDGMAAMHRSHPVPPAR